MTPAELAQLRSDVEVVSRHAVMGEGDVDALARCLVVLRSLVRERVDPATVVAAGLAGVLVATGDGRVGCGRLGQGCDMDVPQQLVTLRKVDGTRVGDQVSAPPLVCLKLLERVAEAGEKDLAGAAKRHQERPIDARAVAQPQEQKTKPGQLRRCTLETPNAGRHDPEPDRSLAQVDGRADPLGETSKLLAPPKPMTPPPAPTRRTPSAAIRTR